MTFLPNTCCDCGRDFDESGATRDHFDPDRCTDCIEAVKQRVTESPADSTRRDDGEY